MNGSTLRDTYHLFIDRFLIGATCMLSFAGCFWPSTNLAELIWCVVGMGGGGGDSGLGQGYSGFVCWSG